MLFYPLEKQLYLPAAPVQLCNCSRRQYEIVGQKYQCLIILCIMVADTSQLIRIILSCIKPLQYYYLVALDASLFVCAVRIKAFVIEISLGTSNKET